VQNFLAVPPLELSGHSAAVDGRVEVPYAFPMAGRYRLWVQVKRAGVVKTAAFDVEVQ
jgi:hypothetical protein